MMNCFEARQEFPSFWRKTATVERRAELSAHLASCAKCDHAFRVFALTAPVLHSETEPSGVATSTANHREFSPYDRPRRFAPAARVEAGPRRWLAISAAAAVFLFASSAAYFSERAPSDTLRDVLSKPDVSASYEATADPLAPELPATESDLAS